MERLSESERSELWDRWEAGESQRSVASLRDEVPNRVVHVDRFERSRWVDPEYGVSEYWR